MTAQVLSEAARQAEADSLHQSLVEAHERVREFSQYVIPHEEPSQFEIGFEQSSIEHIELIIRHLAFVGAHQIELVPTELNPTPETTTISDFVVEIERFTSTLFFITEEGTTPLESIKRFIVLPSPALIMSQATRFPLLSRELLPLTRSLFAIPTSMQRFW